MENRYTKVAKLIEKAATDAMKNVAPEYFQNVIENSGQFTQRVEQALKGIINDIYANRYLYETVATNHGYPANFKIKSITKQIKIIAKLFDIDPSKALEFARNLPELPAYAEGWIALPKVQSLFPHDTPKDAYRNAIFWATQLLSKNEGHEIKFRYWHELTVEKIEQLPESSLEFFESSQDGPIIVIPVQCGFHRRGQSPRGALAHLHSNEVPLGIFAGICISLTHPERHGTWTEKPEDSVLDLLCIGDKVGPLSGDFTHKAILSITRYSFHEYHIGIVNTMPWDSYLNNGPITAFKY